LTARILLADSQPLFNEALFSRDVLHEVVGLAIVAEEALATVHRFRPELVLVDATIDLDGSPPVVARILEAHPDAKVIVLGEDRDVDLLLAAIRAGEGAVPRCTLVELIRRLAAQGQDADSPLARRSPRGRPVLVLLSQAGTTAGSATSCSLASTPCAPTSRTSWGARHALQAGGGHLCHAVLAGASDRRRNQAGELHRPPTHDEETSTW
jgi:hypothetical protein